MSSEPAPAPDVLVVLVATYAAIELLVSTLAREPTTKSAAVADFNPEGEDMSTITPLASASYTKAEADRRTAASAASHDTAAIAYAELCRQSRVRLFEAIAQSRGLVREECLAAIPAEGLVDVLLAALVADGAIVERGGVYAVMPGAA